MHIELDLKSLQSKFVSNPVRVTFGRGCRSGLRYEVDGKKCLVITSERGFLALKSDQHLCWLLSNPKNFFLKDVQANPTVEYLEVALSNLQDGFEVVIAIGGGSVIDVAKVASLVLNKKNPQSVYALKGRDLDLSTVPLYVLPTTSGSGSEVTPFAAIWSAAYKRKISLTGVSLFPIAAYVDPALCDHLPVGVTISCGLDAINQASESIWNLSATPDTIYVATEALKLGFKYLPEIAFGHQNLKAKDGMSLCSLLSGLVISQTKTALCHSISYPLTSIYNVPHGLACAFTMPRVLKNSINADPERFIALAVSLCNGQASLDLLLEKYVSLNKLLEVEKKVMHYVATFENLLSMKSQMITKERSSNALFNVNEEVVENILIDSYKSIKFIDNKKYEK